MFLKGKRFPDCFVNVPLKRTTFSPCQCTLTIVVLKTVQRVVTLDVNPCAGASMLYI